MFDHLDIYTPRERWLVGLADAGLSALTLPARMARQRRADGAPSRILLLRLERIGDLLMTLGAIRAVRTYAPAAQIDLVVGHWNESLAGLVTEVDRVDVVDASWLARGAGGDSPAALARRAAGWRRRRYDLSINFEGDVRSHLLPWLAGARRRVGFAHGGGGALLTDCVAHDAARHVADNSLALVQRAFDVPNGRITRPDASADETHFRLTLPAPARAAARAFLDQSVRAGRPNAPLLAVHVGAGREVKQWPPARFAHAAVQLAGPLGATILLTGSQEDRPLMDEAHAAAAGLGVTPVRVPGTTDLVMVAALVEQCRLLVTGDTGPMHLASAVGTPAVAVFGPSMPWRYGPLGASARVVRVDLSCSPCNRIRRPPARCTGCVPDCLEGISVEAVVSAGRDLLGPEQGIRLQPAARE